ncbi:MAG: threonine/serine dehydratase [Gammaproteobacteria bacterium]|nr:threonine/serine dehydratase [Gammaproteobacteria bacterium]
MTDADRDLPTSAEIFTAAQMIADSIHCTPLISSKQINQLVGCEVFFKCEHLQKVGAFKARGACNALSQLPAGTTMVATHSSGNHGAALAWAAAQHGLQCTVVIPQQASAIKHAAIAAYGAEIVECGPSLQDRESTLAALVAKTAAHVVPPFDDRRIIAGQGTVALEILQQCREQGFTPDLLVAPVGGGGLLAGIGLAAAAVAPNVRVIGAEPQGANDAERSFLSGQRIIEHTPNTIADGLRGTLGQRNFTIIRRTAKDIVTVSEAAIAEALCLIWTRTKQMVEPSAAVSLAAVMAHPARFRNKRVVAVLSGGNIDIDKLGEILAV